MIKMKMFVTFGLDCVFYKKLIRGFNRRRYRVTDEVNSIDILRGTLLRGRLPFSGSFSRE